MANKKQPRTKNESLNYDYDYIVIGSGFGGSVSALRLSEKGYRVLVLEKGKWKRKEDFPKTNWSLKKWLWAPALRWFGLFQVTTFRHISILSGTGVGGGSLVYANTLPVPKKPFFESKSWSHLADWEKELKPFYKTARKMLGAVPSQHMGDGDYALQALSAKRGQSKDFEAPYVAVNFGTTNKKKIKNGDPYFGGAGPARDECNLCGGCMLGCRYNAKNTLDKNYLFFAAAGGTNIIAESKVVDVRPIDIDTNPISRGEQGYVVTYKKSTSLLGRKQQVTAKGIVFSAGVLGTIGLLTNLRHNGALKFLSDKLGRTIRTNNESLLAVTTPDPKYDFSKGIAISGMLNSDKDSHFEPVRYPRGSGFWRLVFYPGVTGSNVIVRLLKLAYQCLRHPWAYFRNNFIRDYAKQTQILLFMQSLDSTIRFTKGIFGLSSKMEHGPKPNPFLPEAYELANQFAAEVGGKVYSPISETLFGVATTAHILGGACMGSDSEQGVIDKNNQVFGYENMLVCDGSMITANLGVNPSLTITALSERAMSKIPAKYSRATDGKRTSNKRLKPTTTRKKKTKPKIKNSRARVKAKR